MLVSCTQTNKTSPRSPCSRKITVPVSPPFPRGRSFVKVFLCLLCISLEAKHGPLLANIDTTASRLGSVTISVSSRTTRIPNRSVGPPLGSNGPRWGLFLTCRPSEQLFCDFGHIASYPTAGAKIKLANLISWLAGRDDDAAPTDSFWYSITADVCFFIDSYVSFVVICTCL